MKKDTKQINYLEVMGGHCFKCHKDYAAKDLNHSIYCKERVGVNKDGGAVACGKLTGKACEFAIDKQIDEMVKPEAEKKPQEICDRCKKPKKHVNEKERCHCGRPIEYNYKMVERTKKYIEECEDEEVRQITGITLKGTEMFKTKLNVKLPSIEGLSLELDVAVSTIYVWEEEYPEFSEVIAKLRAKQATVLLNKGTSGDYNPTIAKVLLTKHGYREGIENTGRDGKDLFPVDPEKKKKSDDAVKKFLKK